jgi:hypothetical protein
LKVSASAEALSNASICGKASKLNREELSPENAFLIKYNDKEKEVMVPDNY